MQEVYITLTITPSIHSNMEKRSNVCKCYRLTVGRRWGRGETQEAGICGPVFQWNWSDTLHWNPIWLCQRYERCVYRWVAVNIHVFHWICPISSLSIHVCVTDLWLACLTIVRAHVTWACFMWLAVSCLDVILVRAHMRKHSGENLAWLEYTR